MRRKACFFELLVFWTAYLRKRAISKTASEIKMVEANGNEKIRPNNLKRRSPGSLPMPSFSSQGNSVENTMSAIKITRTQRIISSPLASTYLYSLKNF